MLFEVNEAEYYLIMKHRKQVETLANLILFANKHWLECQLS